MPLRDPISAYNANNNLEAHWVCEVLLQAGIESQVVEDNSQVGLWLGGTLPEIHKPQVWIERTEADRAAPILADFDRRSSQRNHAKSGSPIEVQCEHCGQQTVFPVALKDSVQRCSHCHTFVDVEAAVVE